MPKPELRPCLWGKVGFKLFRDQIKRALLCNALFIYLSSFSTFIASLPP